MRILEGKVALVTGAASGIGRAIATRLRADGAQVVITDFRRELGEAAAQESGCKFLQQDVCEDRRWSEVVQEIETTEGRLDILVNNAGIVGSTREVSPEDTDLEDWRRVFAVNVEGTFLGCRATIGSMRRAGGGGSIINISSVAALLATPYATAYGASKAAVWQLTRSVAQHCAQHKLNIRCNSVHPGIVRTPLFVDFAQQLANRRGVSLEAVMAEQKRDIPLGEFVDVKELAATVSFLASDEARNITGTKIVIDGGVTGCDSYLAFARDLDRRVDVD